MSHTLTLPARPITIAFARHYFVTMRPYLLYVSGVTGIAGMAIAPSLPVLSTLLIALASFLSYGFGQALTDCSQVDTDSLSAPYRPLVRGQIRRRDVMAVSYAGLALVAVVLLWRNPLNLPIGLAAVAGLATYTWFKRRWWAGPLYNAWIVAALCVMGYLAGSGGPLLGEPRLWPVAGAALLLYANFVLTGYFKDVSADGATGYMTLPVVFGLRVSCRVSHLLALCGVVMTGIAVLGAPGVLDGGPQLWAPFAAAGVVSTILAQMRLVRVTESTSYRAIAPVVHAYVLLMSAIAAAYKPQWAPALAVLVVAYAVTLSLRPMRQQI